MPEEKSVFDLPQWVASTPELFDQTEEFKERIAPLVSALMAECRVAGLPVLVSVGVKQDEKGAAYAHSFWVKSPERAPVGILYAAQAALGNQGAMQDILQANSLRMFNKNTTKH